MLFAPNCQIAVGLNPAPAFFQRLVRGTGLATMLLVLLVAMPRPGIAQDTLRAVAVVNDEVISVLDLAMRTRLAILSAGLEFELETQQRLQPQVLRALIDERLQAQEATRLDIAVTDEQVQEAILRVAQQNEMTPQSFIGFLQQNGILPTIVADQIRANLTWQKVVSVRLGGNVDVREEEVDDVIRRIQSDSGAKEIRISEIFLGIDTVLQEQDVKAAAQRLIEQLRAGAKFDGLARQFSQSATAAIGGDLGWIRESQLPEELQSVVRNLRPGQLTRPIRTNNGIYILYLREARQRTVGDATVALKQILFSVPQGAPDDVVQKAMAGATDARAQIASCDDAASLATKLGSASSGDLGTVRLNDLPTQIRQAVASLPLGQASAPLQLSGGIGVLIVCNRQDGNIDREQVLESLRNDKLNLLARRYLRDLRRQSNVDMRL